jgi:membrane associated rhomboid family serine protease
LSEERGIVEMKSATVGITGLTAVASTIIVLTGGLDQAAATMGFIPARLSGLLELGAAVPAWLTPLSATLVHGGFVHLLLNLVMLVWVGAQVERVLGAVNIIFAYLIGAFVAAAAQWLVTPESLTPMVGASGAISALFGIYALLAGRPKPLTRSPGLNRAIHAAWLLGAWVVIQWMTAQLAGGQGVLIATPAHIGGFIAGLLLERPLLLWRYRRA